VNAVAQAVLANFESVSAQMLVDILLADAAAVLVLEHAQVLHPATVAMLQETADMLAALLLKLKGSAVLLDTTQLLLQIVAKNADAVNVLALDHAFTLLLDVDAFATAWIPSFLGEELNEARYCALHAIVTAACAVPGGNSLPSMVTLRGQLLTKLRAVASTQSQATSLCVALLACTFAEAVTAPKKSAVVDSVSAEEQAGQSVTEVAGRKALERAQALTAVFPTVPDVLSAPILECLDMFVRWQSAGVSSTSVFSIAVARFLQSAIHLCPSQLTAAHWDYALVNSVSWLSPDSGAFLIAAACDVLYAVAAVMQRLLAHPAVHAVLPPAMAKFERSWLYLFMRFSHGTCIQVSTGMARVFRGGGE
jgi:hypothetical protein